MTPGKMSALLVSIFIILHSAIAAASPVLTYFPLNNGDTKFYEFDSGGSSNQTMQLQYTASTSRNGAFIETDNTDGSKMVYDNRAGKLTMPGVVISGEYVWFTYPLVIFSDEVIQNGGNYSSWVRTYNQGVQIYITVETTVDVLNKILVPAGLYNDCRMVSFTMNVYVDGATTPVVTKDVWTLAPSVGKIQVKVTDENGNYIDTAELASGTVAGIDVSKYAAPMSLAAIYSILLGN